MSTNNVRKELSFKYIRGEGIEIGALHQSLPIPSNVKIHYVDRLGYAALLDQYPELSKEEVIRPDIIDDAYSLETIKNESFDFCICNHVFEHMRDPIGAFINWMRILKPGGILYISIPDAGNPLDIGRSVTSLQHIIEDNTSFDIAKERQHFFECAKYWYKTNDNKANEIAESNLQRGYSIHYHVFDDVTINQILDHICSLGIKFRILDHVENEINGVKEYIFIIEKNDYEAEIVKIIECSKNQNFQSDVSVDVIVPIFNAYDDLCKCLISLLKYRDIYRIYLINDCSTDERVHVLLTKIQNFEISFITVIENRENQGFVRSVNRGMRVSKNDVILLNSDTIVTINWAKKIRECAYTRKNIATVTPFTNNGTICSIPEFGKNNQIPPGFTIDSFGNFIESLSFRQYPEIPTAVGFCMFIKRDVMQRIGYFDEASFDKGYCEENDFCMRVINAGFSNQLCDNTFIYHKGESSFSQTKNERIEKNMRILSSRYPNYLSLVAKFCEENPLSDQQLYFKSKLDVWNNNGDKKRILFILHHLGGGTEKHVEDLITSLDQYYIFYIAQIIDNVLTFTEINYGNRIKYCFPMKSFKIHTASNNEYKEIMKKFITSFDINLVHVHHLIGHSFDIFRICAELKIPVLYTIHDFFCICPKVNLLNENGKYCDIPDLATCNFCLSDSYGYPKDFIKSWRSQFQESFKICNSIIAPSNSSFDIVSRCYPEIFCKRTIVEHGNLPQMIEQKTDEIQVDKDIFHIAYIGVLAQHKGRDIFYDLAKSKELSGITKWSVIGRSQKNKEPGYYPDLNITVIGPYKDFNHLRQIIKTNNIDLIILPALWPETFSFTLSEAWCLGLPVLGSNLGAIQERIIKTKGGWTVDMSNIDLVKSKILDIINSKHEYSAVRENIKKIHTTSLDTMAKRYNQLYQKKIRDINRESMPKFDNVELYKAIRLNESIANPFGGSKERLLPKTTARHLYQQFLLCLKENGFRYTIKRVWILLFK